MEHVLRGFGFNFVGLGTRCQNFDLLIAAGDMAGGTGVEAHVRLGLCERAFGVALGGACAEVAISRDVFVFDN